MHKGFDAIIRLCSYRFDRIYKVRFPIKNSRILNAVVLLRGAFKIEIKAKAMKSKVAIIKLGPRVLAV